MAAGTRAKRPGCCPPLAGLWVPPDAGGLVLASQERAELLNDAHQRAREDAERFGIPLIVWSYPRGAAIDAKGGQDCFYAVDYAARTASELGADVVKVNFPQPDKQAGVPAVYRREFSSQEAIAAVVRSANRTLLLVSGGEHAGDEAMLEKARQSMEVGATGLIFGRNVFQRSHDDSLRLIAQLREILAKHPS